MGAVDARNTELPSINNMTGCYTFAGSEGRQPADGCGMTPVHRNGHMYLLHRSDGSVSACLNQFCYRALNGSFALSSNGVGFLRLKTIVGKGNCTAAVRPKYKVVQKVGVGARTS